MCSKSRIHKPRVLNATPAMADVISGSMPVPAPCPRFGRREWLARTPAWWAFRRQILLPMPGGESAMIDGSPELDEREVAGDMMLAFLVRVGTRAMIIAVNEDGTRLMYDEADVETMRE